MDRVTPEARSANMRAVRRKDTAPELKIRRLLHGAGYRFRVGGKGLPGSPDIVFHRRRVVVFVHGCFWHGHCCRKGKLPASNVEFWNGKIERNRARDRRVEEELRVLGWRVIVIWECEINTKLVSLLELSLGPKAWDRR